MDLANEMVYPSKQGHYNLKPEKVFEVYDELRTYADLVVSERDLQETQVTTVFGLYPKGRVVCVETEKLT